MYNISTSRFCEEIPRLLYYTLFLHRKQGTEDEKIKIFLILHMICVEILLFRQKNYVRGAVMAFCSFSKDNESAYTIVEWIPYHVTGYHFSLLDFAVISD